MNERAIRWTAGKLAVFVASLVISTNAAAERSTSLVSAVPDDVFLCVHNKHNPERAFLKDYWHEVFDAVRQSGIGSDLNDLLTSNVPAEAREQVDQFKAQVTQLVEGVDWCGLAAKEMVYAMRPPVPRRSGSNFTVLPPEQIWLLRGKDGDASKNYTGLTNILDTIVAMVNEKAEMQVLKVDKAERSGARVATLKATIGPPDAPSMSVSVAVRDDIILVSIGDALLSDVLAMLEGTGSSKPLTASPRFQAAFAKLPAAEDTMTFFDVRRLTESIRSIATQALDVIGSSGGAKKDEFANSGQNPQANALNAKALEAYRAKDYKRALEYTEQAYEKAPADSIVLYNLACFHALLGHKDEAMTWLEKAVDAGCHAPRQMATDGDLASLRDHPRFKKVLARAAAGAPSGGGAEWVPLAKPIIKRILDIPGMIDYQAGVEYTEGYSTHKRSITVLVPGAAKMPFYPVVAKGKPITVYDRYLPKETTSFALSNDIDLGALYTFLEDTVRTLGPMGEGFLAQWAAIQQEKGFDVRKDFLDWFVGDSITVGMNVDGQDASVLMIKVRDEDKAREKLDAAITFLSTQLKELAAQNPMLAMLTVRTMPTDHEKLEGFQDVFFGMSPRPFTCGVADGYIILAQSAEAAALCLATAAGKHPNVSKNAQLMAEAFTPEGPVNAISYSDDRQFGAKIATILGAISMGGQMATMAVPDPKAQQIVGKLMGMLAKLGTVATKIDFYKSSASDTTFDGSAWHTRRVTHYFSPAERHKVAGP